jgi:cytochrome c oxidase subunit III
MNKTVEIPVDSHHADEEGTKLGMWLFLFTELLLFGGMFLLYSIYRSEHAHQFFLAASELDTFIGTVNTLVLLTSSLTVALSIEALRRSRRKLSITMLILTILFGVVFMINKYFEWSTKIHHGIYPGSETLLSMSDGEMLFFNLYYVMTGLHGLHVLVGMVVLSVMLVFVTKGNQSSVIRLESSGLYWHLVDIIWIFLFPLFYLIT